MFTKVDRYRMSPSPLNVSQSLYEQGKEKILKQTLEEQQIKNYLE